MRILVFSDSHGDFTRMDKAVRMHKSAEVIIFCGDGENDIEYIKRKYPDKMYICVRGNNDWASSFNSTETVVLENKRIFITHGHRYSVKAGLYTLVCAAREQKADIVVFGHTHVPCTEYDDGLYILNPGSCHGYSSTFGYIDITDKGIMTNTVKI